jgi:hypothetical protein
LREVERVLVGEGHLLVCGFNPRGPWVCGISRRGGASATGGRLMSESRARLATLPARSRRLRRYLFAHQWTQLFPAANGSSSRCR